ncbi:MAG: hypothetical protein UV60_C0019G0019 [Parcubacteria group bacterium GW2011_GWA2_43_11]|nr:MAG: hypothetical protein UV60_C0019G0019 [Parcubacteria group bacterium GW2011_GWA2_43_11]
MKITSPYTNNHNSDERGVSLLLVLLISTIMILASLTISQYAQRMVTAMQARSDLNQTVYTAEQVFECVKYWLNKDYRYFTNNDSLSPQNPVCNSITYDFKNNTDTADDGNHPSYDSGIAKFRVPFNPSDVNSGGVDVEVERFDPSLHLFDGFIRIFSQSHTDASSKNAERFQEYRYRVFYGADIMFVIDRSGSIGDSGDRNNRSIDNEWNRMINAINDTITTLQKKMPAPYIGIVSFGDDVDNVGRVAEDCVGAGCNWREADQKLTDTITDLIIDRNGTPENPNDDFPNMSHFNPSLTNISLGISVASAELMGKYYPHTGTSNPPLTSFGTGKFSGEFERIVAEDVHNGFDTLPAQLSPKDRTPDDEFPDIMILITDGAPNVIMTHRRIETLWYQSEVTSVLHLFPLRFINPTQYVYEIGEEKLFRLQEGAIGNVIVDDKNDLLPFAPSIPSSGRSYRYCNDDLTDRPSTVFSSPINVNTFPHMAMCNATLIAEKLKNDMGIIIIAIYVGDNDSTNEAYWLKNHFVSKSFNNEPLFATVNDYGDIRDAILQMFIQLDFVKAR